MPPRIQRNARNANGPVLPPVGRPRRVGRNPRNAAGNAEPQAGPRRGRRARAPAPPVPEDNPDIPQDEPEAPGDQPLQPLLGDNDGIAERELALQRLMDAVGAAHAAPPPIVVPPILPAPVIPAPPSIAEVAVPAIFDRAAVANITDPVALENQRWLNGTLSRKSELDNLLLTTLTYSGVNRKAMRHIALGEFVDFSKLTTKSSSLLDPAAVSIENGSLAVTASLKAIPIITYQQFVDALELWTQATLVIYPHRAFELQSYGKELTTLCRDYNANVKRVIEYDVLVREKVALNKNLSFLSDFGRLQQSHFSAPGSFNTPLSTTEPVLATKIAPSKKGKEKDQTSRADQICNNFNLGKCLAVPCPHGRLHLIKCGKCKTTGHASDDCPAKSSKSAGA